MKIGNNAMTPGMGQVGGAATTSTRPAESGPKAEGVSAINQESTTVQLSKTAQSLMSADGSFDAEKVARIRQSISDGTYKVNPEAIADKLIANAQEVLGRSNNPA